MCLVVETARPDVVSFHFGLPEPPLLARIKAAGCRVTYNQQRRSRRRAGWKLMALMSPSPRATRPADIAECFWLLTSSRTSAAQPGTLAPVPQVVDAVGVPAIAAGGIADGRAIAAAFALGAAGAQIGTAYLLCPEAATPPVHRDALRHARADATVVTNVFSGRPARALVNRMAKEIGPVSGEAPEFPIPMAPLAPLRAKAEQQGSDDFTPLWTGQSAPLAKEMPGALLTNALVEEALEPFRWLAG
jgi:nitronate monooxygenase